MSTRHLLPIAVAGIIGISGEIRGAEAQPAARPPLVMPPAETLPPGPGASVPRALAPRIPIPSTLTPASPVSPSPVLVPAAKPAQPRPADPLPIAFFVATGPAGACGPGCDGWIAADGRIDLEAAQRLRKVLATLQH
jgi:hypothetical protein